MTPRVVALSSLFGVAWHTLIVVLIGGDLPDAASTGMLAGAVAGLVAGWLTVRSRERRHGKESLLDALAAYYLAVVTYAVCIVVIGLLVGSNSPGERLGLLDAFMAAWVACWYAVAFATVLGVVLVPLCFLTRHLLWRHSGRVRPNSAQQPARPEARG